MNASEEDFVAIKSKRNVVDKLISLDAMIAKAEANMGGVAGPVGTVTPEQAVRAQGFKTKVEERDLLRKELEEVCFLFWTFCLRRGDSRRERPLTRRVI